MKCPKTWLKTLGTVSVLSGAPILLRAAGFDLPDQDAFAVGRGMAFVATADNPSAIFYNPAGITQLEGNNLRSGIYSIYLDPTYQRPGGGQTYNNESHLHAVPQFYYTYGSTNIPVSFGLGVYSPFGLGLKWPQDTGFRTVGTQSSLTCVTFNPVVAFKLSPQFSIGGGVMVNYANVDLQQGLTPVSDNDIFRFTGDGWNVGYNLGILWQPTERISLGATYRSGNTQHLTGKTQIQSDVLAIPLTYTPASADYAFPAVAIFGISYRPTPKWNLEFDADYTDWNALSSVTINQSGMPPLRVPFDWESSWYYEFGATRYFDNHWHVSAGYIYNENSIPSSHYTPLVTDLNRHFFSVGTGYKGKQFDFDIAYQFGYGPTRSVSGSAPSPAGQTADGNYEFFSQAVAVSVGWHF